jgi:ankyrin repeat protein
LVAKHLIEKNAFKLLPLKEQVELLHKTSKMGQRDIVDVNTRDVKGLTSLHHASHKGHTEVAQLLVKKAADPCVSDNEGVLPYYPS